MSESSTAYVCIEGRAKNWEEAIRTCGEELVRKSFVGEEFITACIEREKVFPTGLPTEIPVAIPHAASDEVHQTFVCVLKLDAPVIFQRMDEPSNAVEVQMIFNLAIKGANAHLEFLQRLMAFVTDREHLTKCLSLSGEEVTKYLEEKLV